jgi:hypothetical protein
MAGFEVQGWVYGLDNQWWSVRIIACSRQPRCELAVELRNRRCTSAPVTNKIQNSVSAIFEEFGAYIAATETYDMFAPAFAETKFAVSSETLHLNANARLDIPCIVMMVSFEESEV